MNLPSISEIFIKAKMVVGRFPLTSIWVILGSFYCIFLLENTENDFPDHHFNLLMTLILGISWFIGMQFFIEQQKKPKAWQSLKLVVLALLIGFFFYMPVEHHYDTNPKYLIRFFLFLIAGHLFVLIAPFIIKWNKNVYWNYLKIMAISIVRSAFFSGILYLGLALALAAVEALFDIQISGKRYGQTFVFCLGIVNTLVYLSDFPKNTFEQTQIQFQKALEVLVKYILIPLIILYLIILYAYSFKILMDWELPKGWVSYLVIALSLLGFLIQVMINPIQKEIKSWAINKFYPFFYILLMPLLILLFVAIFRRITDYGITENRYFVVAIAVWICGIAVYFLLSKQKSLKILAISLFSIAILSSFGFWGAIDVSNKSQANQFKQLYTKALQNNRVVSQTDYNRLQSILDYLDERESATKLDQIIGLSIERFRDTLNSDYRNRGWLNTVKIWDTLNLKVDPTTLSDSNANNKYYNYDHDWNTNFTESIAGYDSFRTLSINDNSSIDSTESKDFYIKFNNSDIRIEFYDVLNDSLIMELDLRKELQRFTFLGENLYNVSQDKLIISDQNDLLSYKIIISQLAFNKENDSIKFYSLNGFLLSKKQ